MLTLTLFLGAPAFDLGRAPLADKADFDLGRGRLLQDGRNSEVWGRYSKASGDEATAFGHDTEASAFAATAFGYNAVASGDYSTAFGADTVASGTAATAFEYYAEPNLITPRSTAMITNPGCSARHVQLGRVGKAGLKDRQHVFAWLQTIAEALNATAGVALNSSAQLLDVKHSEQIAPSWEAYFSANSSLFRTAACSPCVARATCDLPMHAPWCIYIDELNRDTWFHGCSSKILGTNIWKLNKSQAIRFRLPFSGRVRHAAARARTRLHLSPGSYGFLHVRVRPKQGMRLGDEAAVAAAFQREAELIYPARVSRQLLWPACRHPQRTWIVSYYVEPNQTRWSGLWKSAPDYVRALRTAIARQGNGTTSIVGEYELGVTSSDNYFLFCVLIELGCHAGAYFDKREGCSSLSRECDGAIFQPTLRSSAWKTFSSFRLRSTARSLSQGASNGNAGR